MHTIRRGGPGDLPEIQAIQAAAPEAAQWEPAEYLAYDLLVAIEGSRVTGFVVARTLAPGEREILNLAVRRECRRRGMARALLEALLESFRGVVYLEVRPSNLAAREFYKSVGFQELGVRPEYYDSPPESAIVMKFHSC
jgi:[ribosomal protein S18]-alanine N-acetyltransferase